MLRLLAKNVGIIPIHDAEKIGHIWVPDVAKERVDQGIVKYLGPDCEYAKVGAFVTFSGYSGTRISITDPERPDQPGEDLIILNEKWLHAEIVDLPSTDVPGLYFKDRDGEYFNATYEMAMMLIGRALQEAPWRIYNPTTGKGINVRPVKPGHDEKADYAREDATS
jgi:hypothetical protein